MVQKKEYTQEDMDEKYTQEEVADMVLEETNEMVFPCCMMIGLAIFLTIAAIGLFGGFDQIHYELDLDADRLAGDYIIQYYPEYENCSFEYVIDVVLGEYVYVYCDALDNRDGLSFSNDDDGSAIKINFEDITMDEIIRQRVMNG